MVSYLERSFNHSNVQMAPIDVHLEAAAGFIPGLGRLSADVKGSRKNNPWGAFSVIGLPVTLSYPRSDHGRAASEPHPPR
jgi:hypothetical protein